MQAGLGGIDSGALLSMMVRKAYMVMQQKERWRSQWNPRESLLFKGQEKKEVNERGSITRGFKSRLIVCKAELC